MIEVRAKDNSDTGDCMACEEYPAKPTAYVTRVGGNTSTWSTRYCVECAVKLLQALLFVVGSNERIVTRRKRSIQANGPGWLQRIESLKEGDPCEFRYPARSNWCLGIVVENGGAGYWKVQRTTSDDDGANGDIVGSIYIEHVRCRGQTEAWA